MGSQESKCKYCLVWPGYGLFRSCEQQRVTCLFKANSYRFHAQLQTQMWFFWRATSVWTSHVTCDRIPCDLRVNLDQCSGGTLHRRESKTQTSTAKRSSYHGEPAMPPQLLWFTVHKNLISFIHSTSTKSYNNQIAHADIYGAPMSCLRLYTKSCMWHEAVQSCGSSGRRPVRTGVKF